MTALPVGKGEIRRTTSRRRQPRSRSSRSARMLQPALAAADELDATVANMRFVKPLDVDLVLRAWRASTTRSSPIEENVVAGGAGSAVAEALAAAGHRDSACCNWGCLTPLSTTAIPRSSSPSAGSTSAASSRPSMRGVRGAADGPVREAGGVSNARMAPTRPVAIFRFSRTEGPGLLRRLARRPRHRWQLVAHSSEGAPVPVRSARIRRPRDDGRSDERQRSRLPGRPPLSSLLRAAVDSEVPVIGHCLGGQLLAAGAGCAGDARPVAEIGWLDVDVCDSAAEREWFGGRAAFKTFQWHYDAFALARGGSAGADQQVQRQPGIRRRRTAHRPPVSRPR